MIRMMRLIELVINGDKGEFTLSDLILHKIAERKQVMFEEINPQSLSRDDPDLVAVVNALKDETNTDNPKLKIVTVKVEIIVRSVNGKEYIDVDGGV